MIMEEKKKNIDIGKKIGIIDIVRSKGMKVVEEMKEIKKEEMLCDRIEVMEKGKIVEIG